MSKNHTTFAKGLLAFALLLSASQLQSQTLQDQERLELFEVQVEDLRKTLKIPGMSAVIVKDQKVLWAKGFGFADVENKIPATPDTLYHIASLTKTFSGTLIMQLVEQGKLSLDESISDYSPDVKDKSVKIKHVITHTSEGTPGERYSYNGNQYDYLKPIIEKRTGKPIGQVIIETFFDPLDMSGSVPFHNVLAEGDDWIPLLGKEKVDRYGENLKRLAQPYTYYGEGEIVHVPYPPRDVNAAAGLLSTVLDLAKYDTAIDKHVFLKKETQDKAWTNFPFNNGQPSPSGLGWFVTDHKGYNLVWYYGHWGTGFSATYLKVPEKNLTLILLTNSEANSDHQFKTREGGEDDGKTILKNVFVANFLHLFVSEQMDDKDAKAALGHWVDQRKKNARKFVQVDTKILDDYVGRYQYEASPRTFTVSREGNKLFANSPISFKSEFFPESDSTFFSKATNRRLVFVKENGQVTGAEVRFDSGEVLRARKIK